MGVHACGFLDLRYRCAVVCWTCPGGCGCPCLQLPSCLMQCVREEDMNAVFREALADVSLTLADFQVWRDCNRVGAWCA